MRNILTFFVIIIFLVTTVEAKDLNTNNDCRQFYGKGYCVDYIQMVTGLKQSGNANTWKPNITNNDVQEGDVAIFHIDRYGHVAYVEKVYRDNNQKPVEIHISEMNWGSPLDGCGKSPNNFNVVTYRIVRHDGVWGYWRPFQIKIDEIEGQWNGFLISSGRSGTQTKYPIQVTFHKLSETSFDGKTSEISQVAERFKFRKLKFPLNIVEGQYNSTKRKFSFSVKDPYFWGRGIFYGEVLNKHKITGEYKYSYENDGTFELIR